MLLSIIVEIIGFISCFAFKNPASNAKNPPDNIPTINNNGIIIYDGRPTWASDKPTTAVIVPPNNICPHPPILKNLIIKGIVKA